MSSVPAAEYHRRLAARRDQIAVLTRADARISAARLLTFGAAVALALLVWQDVIGSAAWLLIPAAVFLWLVVHHARVIAARRAAERVAAFYENGLARLEDRWAGTGEPGERHGDPEHPYAADLDLFGHGSLFELLSTARTRAGEQMLAGWLKHPADAAEIRARHEAIAELTPLLDLREHLAVVGDDIRAGVDPDALIAWAAEPPTLAPRWLRWLSVVTTLIVIAVVAVWATGTTGFMLVLMALALQGVATATQRARVEHLLHASDAPARELGILLHVLVRLQRERFVAPRLVAIQRELEAAAGTASTAIRRLQKLLELHDWEHNLMFAPMAAAVMWDTHIAWAVQQWRLANGRYVSHWVRAAGELEAFASLSAYRYEHPDDPFPQLVDSAGGGRSVAVFDGAALGHPLLAAARMIRNDVSLAADGTGLLVVSGSNMSGKSTLLRTVGVNAVLALAGAPVRATSLRLSPLALGATLRIQDSLQEGRSRFYAEITRIRELADLAGGPIPLLFLLDELFHGTNSHDRLVGASGVLRGLLDKGAIGLITTHDLALTAVADTLAPRAANVHFEDVFEDGEIRFDYRMKPGPVTRSNAIALMRAVGLDVPST